tara:strand:- start:1733 stop:3694 length:1962 start_codon:yes stop_codon:yes gene_type:complete
MAGDAPTPNGRTAHPRLLALAEAASSTVASILSTRNAELAMPTGKHGTAGKGPWYADVLYGEREYLPTKKVYEILLADKQNYDFCILSEFMCCQMNQAARENYGQSVDVSGYVTLQNTPYFERRTFQLQSGNRQMTLRVGGLCADLGERLRSDAAKWLSKTDRSMLRAFDDLDDQDPLQPPELQKMHFHGILEDLAGWMANFITYSDAPDEDTGRFLPILNARDVELIALGELTRVRGSVEMALRRDVALLETLARIATSRSELENVSSPEDMARLRARLTLLCQRPPPELRALDPSDAKFQLGALEAACDDETPDVVLIELLDTWRERHGAAVAAAAHETHRMLSQCTPDTVKPFWKVVEFEEDGKPTLGHLPPLAFAQIHKCYALVHEHSIFWSRADQMGRRIIRLCSLLWQLAARIEHGSPLFHRGKIAALTVQSVTERAIRETRMVLQNLETRRRELCLGFTLKKFHDDFYNEASDLNAELRHALAYLSPFSFEEIQGSFHPYSDIRRRLLPLLTVQTHQKTLCKVPESYHGVVSDVLDMLLPLVKRHRSLLRLHPTATLHPIAELLRTIPKVVSWTPLEGKLQLSLEELKDVPVLAKDIVRALEKKTDLVAWKRPYLGNQKHAAKHSFVFDTAKLWPLLRWYHRGSET